MTSTETPIAIPPAPQGPRPAINGVRNVIAESPAGNELHSPQSSQSSQRDICPSACSAVSAVIVDHRFGNNTGSGSVTIPDRRGSLYLYGAPSPVPAVPNLAIPGCRRYDLRVMKRTERHHLKENELERLARQARETVGMRKRETTVAIAAIVIVGAGVLGYVAWKDRINSRAEAMLAEALAVTEVRVGAPVAPGTPGAGPSFATERARSEAARAKFKAAADANADTDAGIFARYRQAGTEMELGHPKQAAAAYQQVVDRAG